MSSTLLTLLLTGVSVAPAFEHEYSHYPFYGPYGRATYGAYGSYGSYGTYGDELPNIGVIMPYYVYPQAQAQGGRMNAAPEKKQEPAVEKRINELKTMLKDYEKKVQDLEQKLGEVNSVRGLHDERLKFLETSQAKLMDIFEQSQAKLIENIENKLDQRLKAVDLSGFENKLNQGVADLAARLTVIETQVQAVAKKQEAAEIPTITVGAKNEAIEKRLAFLEKLILEKQKQLVTATTTNTTNNFGKNGKSEDLYKSGVPFNRGMIIVSLPADAKLFLDGVPSTVGTNLRTFISPEIEVGKNYYYTLRVEMIRQGKLVTDSQRVYFQPGREVRVSFDHLETVVGEDPRSTSPRITVSTQP